MKIDKLQRKVLKRVLRMIRNDPLKITLLEMGNELGVKARDVKIYCKFLKKKGYIKRIPVSHRRAEVAVKIKKSKRKKKTKNSLFHIGETYTKVVYMCPSTTIKGHFTVCLPRMKCRFSDEIIHAGDVCNAFPKRRSCYKVRLKVHTLAKTYRGTKK